jgi:hypothetical protein
VGRCGQVWDDAGTGQEDARPPPPRLAALSAWPPAEEAPTPLCYAIPMLCYAMLCYAMICYAMLCYATLCYAMLCYATLRYAIAMLRYARRRRRPPRR